MRTAPKVIVRHMDTSKRAVRTTISRINECELPPSFFTDASIFLLKNKFKIIPPKWLVITNTCAIIPHKKEADNRGFIVLWTII